MPPYSWATSRDGGLDLGRRGGVGESADAHSAQDLEQPAGVAAGRVDLLGDDVDRCVEVLVGHRRPCRPSRRPRSSSWPSSRSWWSHPPSRCCCRRRRPGPALRPAPPRRSNRRVVFMSGPLGSAVVAAVQRTGDIRRARSRLLSTRSTRAVYRSESDAPSDLGRSTARDRRRTPARATTEGGSRCPDRTSADRGRGRRRAAHRHDDRHRRMGQSSQADVAHPRDPPLRPRRPDDRQLRRPRRRPAVPRRQGARRSSRASCRSTRSRSSRTTGRPARTARSTAAEWDEGMLLLGLQAAAWRVPFLPTRAGLGSDVPGQHARPAHRHLALRDGRRGGLECEELLAVPALAPRRRAHPPEPRRPSRQRPVSDEDLFMDDLMVMAARAVAS